MKKIAITLMTFLLCASISSQVPQKLSKPGISPGVYGVLEIPETPGPHPGVVILHGSNGWSPAYNPVTKDCANSGFVTLTIDYFAETGQDTGRVDKLSKWPLWQEMARNAVDFLQNHPSSYGCPVGLIGYSRGAFLAVSVASSIPEVKAVVDFYGGGGGGPESIESEVKHFPPLLIFHGEADSAVHVTQAYHLKKAVIYQGGEVEIHIYPNLGHAFNVPQWSSYSKSATDDSWQKTIDFLRQRLGDLEEDSKD